MSNVSVCIHDDSIFVEQQSLEKTYAFVANN
jgi:hypothetical protein